jgi:hypothetical protein
VNRKGNPNWATGLRRIDPPREPPAFEVEVERLGITAGEWLRSSELTTWVRANCRDRYVPEQLLAELGLETSR